LIPEVWDRVGRCIEITQNAIFVPIPFTEATIFPFILHPFYPLPGYFYAIIVLDRLTKETFRCQMVESLG